METPHTPGTTWRRIKFAVATLAVAALSVFGGAAVDTPDAPPADHEAGGTWSIVIGPGDWDGEKGPGPIPNGGTWS